MVCATRFDVVDKKHCNFQIVGKKLTGTCRFTTGYYGVTVLPTEFQKMMEHTLANKNSVFVYKDIILILILSRERSHESAG